MIAWRASSPACLPVVDLPVMLRQCRLVGRDVERGVFVSGSVLAICPMLVLLSRLSAAWFISLTSCFDELPSCLISLLVSSPRLVVRLGRRHERHVLA